MVALVMVMEPVSSAAKAVVLKENTRTSASIIANAFFIIISFLNLVYFPESARRMVWFYAVSSEAYSLAPFRYLRLILNPYTNGTDVRISPISIRSGSPIPPVAGSSNASVQRYLFVTVV